MSEFDVAFLNDSQIYSGLIDSAEFNDEFLFSSRASSSGGMSLPRLSVEGNLPELPGNGDIRDSSSAISLGEISINDLYLAPVFPASDNTKNNFALAGDEAVNILGTTNDIDSLTGASYSAQLSGDRDSLTALNTFESSTTGISGTIVAGDGNFPVDIWQYNGNGRINASIDPNKETVVVIHGWNPDKSEYQPKDYLEELTKTIGSKPDLQVLALDWGKAAIDSTFILGNLIPLDAAKRIRPVAEWAAQTLTQLGIAPEKITLVGHSLGSYVSAEIGKMLGGVKNLVALDPAFPTNRYDVDGRESGQQRVTDFNQAAINSLAFFAGESWIGGGIAGDAPQAATAHNSFAIDFEGGNIIGNFVSHHNDVISVFNDAIADGYLTLPDLSLLPHQNDWYGGKSEKLSSPTLGNHEGVIKASKIDNAWNITALNYIDLFGTEQTTWAA